MRIDYQKVLPAAPQAMLQLEEVVHRSDLEPELLELVKIRASQLNHCAHCLDMHTKDARSMGESEQRIHLLAAWREAPLYSERERAALAWCESLTLRGWSQEHGRVSSTRSKAITRRVNGLCAELRVHAGLLVDAFGIPDAVLAAPIGVRSSRVGSRRRTGH
jgi:AhpD family alkylhydroperoxidase